MRRQGDIACASRIMGILCYWELGMWEFNSKEFPLPVEPENGYLAINDEHKQEYALLFKK